MKIINTIFIIMAFSLFIFCKNQSENNKTKKETKKTSQKQKVKKIHTDDIPIVNAVNNNDFNEVDSLLKKGISPNSKNKFGIPILILAAYNGYNRIVEILLVNRGNVNSVDRDRDTALHNAVYKNHTSVVKTLLIFGANKNIKNKKGKTPKRIAIEKGFDSIIEIFEDKNNSIKKRKASYAIIKAIKNNDYKKVKLLLGNGNINVNFIPKEGVKVNDSEGHVKYPYQTNKYSMFLIAVQFSDVKILKLLLEHGADINYYITAIGPISGKHYSAMDYVSFNKPEIIKFLVDNGIRKNNCYRAIKKAILNNNKYVERILLNYGVKDPTKNITYTGEGSFLLKVVDSENIKVLQRMINNGMSTNTLIKYQCCGGGTYTLLSNAIIHKKIKLAKYLINKGADVNLTTKQSLSSNRNPTPLMLASGIGNIELVKLLIRKGANVKTKIEEKTALSIAKENKYSEIVRILKKAGAID